MTYTEVNKISWANRLVRSNELTAATYTLPPDAHRILSVAISMIRQKDKQLHTYRIYAKQLIDFFPALKSDKNAIARLDKVTDALMWSYIKIKNKNGWLKRNLIHSCVLNRVNGAVYVDIRLDDDMVPFLIGLSWWFSSPKIENIRHFKKENHFKLYAFFYAYLYRWSTWEIPLSHIREILSIQKKQYLLIGHLKSRLLNPTIDLINRTTDIKVEYTHYKHGKKIAGFIFDIQKNSKIVASGAFGWKSPGLTGTICSDNNLAKKYSTFGIKQTEVERLIKRFWPKYLEQLYLYVLEKKKRNQIGSAKNYFFWILKKEPPVESLLSDSCRHKKEKERSDKIKEQQFEHEKLQRDRRGKDNKIITSLVEKYRSKLSVKQLMQLQREFWESIYGQSLKLWKKHLDFSNNLVAASFQRYIYRKNICQDFNCNK